MTALCGGGTSSPVSGWQILQNLSPDAVVEVLTGSEMAWFAAYAYAAGWVGFNLTNLCATDPPPLPTIDANRLFGYFNPLNPQGAAELRADAIAVLGHYLWFSYCKCDNGTTLTPPAPLTQPTGISINPPLRTTHDTGTCANLEPESFTEVTTDTKGFATIPFLTGANVVQNGARYLEIENNFWLGGTSGTPLNKPVSWTFNQLAGSTIVRSDSFAYDGTLVVPGSTTAQAGQLVTLPIEATVTSFSAFMTVTGLPSTGVEVSIGGYQYCTDLPVSSMPACCPPDPSLVNLLQQILQLDQQILASLPTPINSYADSTVHAGLVNAGQFVLSTGTIGVRAHFQSLPASFGGNMGNPPLAYRAGRITASANTEPLQDFPVQFDQQVFALPNLTTEINYTLPVGVVLTLTELTRGP